MTTKDLQRERDSLFAETQSMLRVSEKAGRDLTEEEHKEFEHKCSQVSGLDRRIGRAADLEKLSGPGKRVCMPPAGHWDSEGQFHASRAKPKGGDGIQEFKSLRNAEPLLGFSGDASIAEHFGRDAGPLAEVCSRPGAFGRYVQSVACPSPAHAMGFLSKDERRLYFDQSTAPNSSGGYLVPEAFLAGFFIDRLRAQMVTMRAGAITIPLSSDSSIVGRLASGPTFSVHGENVQESTTSLAFDAITLTPRTVGAWLRLSDEWLQDAVNGAALIENTLVAEMSVELDRLALVGGASSTPTGLVTLAGNSVSQAPSSMTYSHLLDAIDAIRQDNAQPTALVLSSATQTVLSKLLINSETNHFAPPPPEVAALRKFVTEAVTSSYVLVGDFSHLVWGIRQNVTIKREAEVARNSQLVSCTVRLDFAATQPNAFCKISA